MKMVTFAKDCAPHVVGETRLVPDDVAAELEKQKMIWSAEPWPKPAAQPEKKSQAVKPERAILRPGRPAAGHDRRQAR